MTTQRRTVDSAAQLLKFVLDVTFNMSFGLKEIKLPIWAETDRIKTQIYTIGESVRNVRLFDGRIPKAMWQNDVFLFPWRIHNKKPEKKLNIFFAMKICKCF